jgi:cytoskeletal protein RodZ
MDVGSELRTSREALGLSLAAIAQRTRVQPRILAAIEQNDRTAIPPRPFGRGFVHAYAREVGLDPDRTVREYFGQFAAPLDAVVVQEPSTKTNPIDEAMRGRVLATVASGVAIVAIAALLLFRQTATSSSSRDAGVVGTSGSAAAGPVVPAVNADSDRVKPPPAVPATRETGINVVLVATGPCWVTASADGRRVLYQLLVAGDRPTLHAQEDVTIRAGNAGALTWTVNGRDIGAFGALGAVRDVKVTSENLGEIK